MKRLILILVIAGLLIGGCGAKADKETVTVVPQLSARETEQKIAGPEGESAENSAVPRGPRPFAQPPEDTQPTSQIPIVIDWGKAKNHIGEEVTVCGPVMSTYYDSVSRDRPTYLHLGNPFPDPDRFAVIIRGRDRLRFPQPPEAHYLGKNICVTGMILQDEGIPWMALQSRTKIEEQ